jgi:hypothetical protein
MHRDYDYYTDRNDVALIFLSQCVPMTATVQPIKIATSEGEAWVSLCRGGQWRLWSRFVTVGERGAIGLRCGGIERRQLVRPAG